MGTATPQLDRLMGRLRRRAVAALAIEAFLCLLLGGGLAGLLMILGMLWRGPLRPEAALLLAGAAVPVLVGLLAVRAAGRSRRGFWILCFVLGWSLAGAAWLLMAGPVEAACDELTAGGRVAAASWTVLVEGLLPLLLLQGGVACLLVVLRRSALAERLPLWVDRRTGSRLLLTTASDLAGAGRPLTAAEQAVVARAERRAARRELFGNLSIRRLGGPWWALAGILILGLLLAAALAVSSYQQRAGHAVEAGPPAYANEDRRAAARRLVQIALQAHGTDASTAASVQKTAEQLLAVESADQARRTLQQEQARLAAEVRKAEPLLEALARLGGSQAGPAIQAVLADPRRSPAQAQAAADQQVRALAEGEWSAVQRARLADELRQAAGELADRDPELSAELSRAADALQAADWKSLLERLSAIVQRIQPIARRHQIDQAALRVIAEELAALSAAPSPPPLARPPLPGSSAATVETAANAFVNQAPPDVHRQLEIARLTPRQRQVVEGYFARGN